jgi:hypothetical protein
MLALLSSHGSKVTQVGRSIIDGVAVKGYSVIPNRRYELSTLQKEHVPASLKAGAEKLAKSTSSKYTVWIDHSNLMRRMNMAMTIPTGPKHTGIENITMDFTHYGILAQIVPPPKSQVASYAQFTKAEEKASASFQ